MSHIEIAAMEQAAGRAADFLRALASENRLLVVCRLAEGEHSVGGLVAAVGLSQSAVSQHLARLRRDGLVATRRDAQTIYYSLASDAARQIIGILYDRFCSAAVKRQRAAMSFRRLDNAKRRIDS
jgi:DNA-binding transcriptional ArsR family regulator